MEKKVSRRVELPAEDAALADVIQVIVKDFKGDVKAFFNQNRKPSREDENEKVKSESAELKKFVKCL